MLENMLIMKDSGFVNLSQFQRQMLVYQTINTSSVEYNIIKILEINVSLNVALLKRAHVKIIEQYEILRTRFVKKEDDFYQQIEPIGVSDIVVMHCHEYVSSIADMNSVLEKPFSLFELPLHRVAIGIGSTNLIGVSLHHSVADGYTALKLLEQLLDAYFIIKIKGNLELQEQNIVQYRNYVAYEKNVMNTFKTKAEEFWGIKLDAYTVPLLLHTLSSKKQRENSRRYTKLMNTQLSQILVCGNNISAFNFFLTAFQLAIMRGLGMSDFVMGTVISSRENFLGKNKKIAMGPMINLIPIRLNLSENDTFLDASLQSKLNYYQCLKEYSACSFASINSERRYFMHNIGAATYDVVMVYDKESSINNMDCQAFNIITAKRHAPYQILLTIKQLSEGVIAIIDYNSSIFSHDFIAAVFQYMVTAIELVIKKGIDFVISKS